MSARAADQTKGFATRRSDDPYDPVMSFGYQVRSTHRLFERVLQSMIADKELQVGHWYLLRILWQQDGLTQRELAEMSSITESTAVVVLSKMESLGLIRRERDRADGRKISVYVTKKGQLLRKKLLPELWKINAIAIAGISERELDVFLRTTWQMQENLRDYVGQNID